MDKTDALKLGPDGYTGIAILGTAGSSMALAPFKDPSWAIWACSPGAYSICAQNRSDVWFEPHRWLPTSPGMFGAPGTKPWFSPEFHQFLANHKGPVMMTGDYATLRDQGSAEELLAKFGPPQKSIPTSVPIPYGALVRDFGPYFWTSTISYMLAMAIATLVPRVKNGENVFIGLWGVDMSATEEWAYQRPGCQHFVGLAAAMGIHVVLPQESDLMRPPTMYGIGEANPRHIKWLAKKAELEARRAQIAAQQNEAVTQSMQINGALSEINYLLDSWCDDVDPDITKAISAAPESVAKRDDQPKDTTGAQVFPLAHADTR